ncbi:CLUMA_CG011620, isoform A [Clunio marinus]|uniref:CLUMA_CG011620, isoform A n=1 Tax=Clunio marinus TaxID=568069 RepID=A0A1J1IER7_9DIPT|nr:CLUMA_CG011620, isoform A [Clunio marinus]
MAMKDFMNALKAPPIIQKRCLSSSFETLLSHLRGFCNSKYKLSEISNISRANSMLEIETHGNTDIDLLQKYIYHCGCEGAIERAMGDARKTSSKGNKSPYDELHK